METLEISKENAIKAYEEASEKTKKVLANLFGHKTFQKEITERLKIFDDILTELGIDHDSFWNSVKGLEPDEVAYKQIKLIAKAFNEGWIPDYNNSNEYKYYPWFKAVGSGSGCSYGGFGYGGTYTTVGSRLVYKNRDHAIYAGKQFIQIYNQYLS